MQKIWQRIIFSTKWNYLNGIIGTWKINEDFFQEYVHKSLLFLKIGFDSFIIMIKIRIDMHAYKPVPHTNDLKNNVLM